MWLYPRLGAAVKRYVASLGLKPGGLKPGTLARPGLVGVKLLGQPDLDQQLVGKIPLVGRDLIGAYTKEEADKWSAEYNEAMSGVPTESDN